MRTIKFYLAIWLYGARYANKMTGAAKKFHKKRDSHSAYRAIDKYESRIMRGLIKVAGATVTTKGIENIDINETYLFVSNHQGNYDIPLLYTYSPIKMAFVAKEEIRKIPVLGRLMELRGCLFLNRDDPRKGIKTIQQEIEFLKSGESLSIFPEGKRSKGHTMGAFKPGSLRLAIKSGVKILPVVIKDSYKLMEANKGKIRPASVEVEFLPPIETKTYKDATTLSKNVEGIIRYKLAQ